MGLDIIRTLIRDARQRGCSPLEIFKRIEDCQILPQVMHEFEEGSLSASDIGLTDAEIRSKILRFKIQKTAQLALWNHSAKCAAESLNCPYILLKGAPMGALLFQNPIWRSTSDIDLWIPQQELPKAVQNLENSGYHLENLTRPEATNQCILFHDTLAPIELHWALAVPPWKSPSFDEAYPRTQFSELPGISVRTLGPDDLWIHLLLHAHQHYFALKTWIDCIQAAQILPENENLLRQYSLTRLNRLVRNAANAFTPNLPAEIHDDILRFFVRTWFMGMLGKSSRGRLIFGEDSKITAAAGVLIRAFSMGLLDDSQFRAAAHILFKGPHKIGSLIHAITSNT